MVEVTDNVVTISNLKPSVRKKERKPGTLYCAHKRLWLETHLRALECRDCGAILDAYDWLCKRADEEESASATVVALRTEIIELTEERGRLRMELHSLKARLPEATRRARAEKHRFEP